MVNTLRYHKIPLQGRGLGHQVGNQDQLEVLAETEENLHLIVKECDDEYQLQPWGYLQL